MNLGIQRLVENVGMSFENIVLLIFLIGSLIFFAKDFKLGLIYLFFGSGCISVWFLTAGWNFVPSITLFFISLILLALSLYFVSETVKSGAVI